MNNMRKGAVTWLTALFCMIMLTVGVWASVPVDPTPETAIISDSLVMDVQGTATTSGTLSWQQSSETLHDPPLEPGGWPWTWFDFTDNTIIYGYTVDPFVTGVLRPAPAGEVQYTAGYYENTLASNGATSYTSTTRVDSAGKTAGENNIAVDKLVTFEAASEQGRMVSTEKIVLDGAGAQTVSGDLLFCPFASDKGPFFPQFCNIVESGSSVDVTRASVSTSSSERFVTTSAGVPISQSYMIVGKGSTPSSGASLAASGTMSAFMNAHLQEGRAFDITPAAFDDIPNPQGFDFGKAADITYSDAGSATGLIQIFSRSYNYIDTSFS